MQNKKRKLFCVLGVIGWSRVTKEWCSEWKCPSTDSY